MSDEPTPLPVEAQPGPTLLRREPWVDLDNIEFPGFRMRIWLGFSSLDWNRVQDPSLPVSEKEPLLARIILEHNRWRDEDGAEYPAANEPGFWSAIPIRLGVVIIQTVRDHLYELPNSLRPTRPR